MKTKTYIRRKRPKLPSQVDKTASVNRSTAAKQAHHQKRIKKHGKLHFRILVGFLLVLLVVAGIGATQVGRFVPPAGDQANVDAYVRAAQAHAQAQREAASVQHTVAQVPDQIGSASWYALGLRSPDALTCASTKFPRGTYLRVKDLRNNNEVTCLVNDYGPEAGTKRVIDLSRGSYSALEGLGSGTMPVEIRVASGP